MPPTTAKRVMPETTIPRVDNAIVLRIRDELVRRHRFLITSHARPDGDSIGSQLAIAYALRALGKEVRIVNADPPPPHYLAFPGVGDIEIADNVAGDYDALIVMECSDARRPGVSGLEQYFIINIDHHVGNTGYGALNWFDESAAACGEMVVGLIDSLGVPLTREIATHIYLAILTDTGSFHHSNITPRTFEICRRTVEGGVNPGAMAQSVFDSNSFGKLKLIGALLGSMQLEADGQVAMLYMDDRMLVEAGCTYNDTEGLINLPLTAREIQAVIFFKVGDDHQVRVSLRSKGALDVREIARGFGGGGHRNAAGFTVEGRYEEVRGPVVQRVVGALSNLVTG